ncbi:MAG: cell division control protein Cdc6, partial [Candidatus Hydrothermarchaeota archaeon]|nr:cell division control protein Cdc6 [Candidatus Hydrothermarchaeota archaeon]
TTKQLAPKRGWGADEYYRFFGKTLDDRGGIFIVVLDEVDKLVPESENVLFNLTRANDHILSNAEISLIGISNDLKFYDGLDPRIKSSMCQREIIINPYTAPQLEKILAQRAKEAFNKGILANGAISLCASLAAQEHGDARKAIDLLRLAGELAEAENAKKIDEKYVRAAREELEKSRVKEVIKGLPIQTKTALLAITQLAGKKGSTITGEAYEHYRTLAPHCVLSPITPQRFKCIIDELSMMKICDTYILTRG